MRRPEPASRPELPYALQLLKLARDNADELNGRAAELFDCVTRLSEYLPFRRGTQLGAQTVELGQMLRDAQAAAGDVPAHDREPPFREEEHAWITPETRKQQEHRDLLQRAKAATVGYDRAINECWAILVTIDGALKHKGDAGKLGRPRDPREVLNRVKQLDDMRDRQQFETIKKRRSGR